ncbi:MAG: hypothetical protein P4L50_05995 [Anaerolineaceae bacterium]|nr:hypothetical protein [Anaerolineaceae bacterium]
MQVYDYKNKAELGKLKLEISCSAKKSVIILSPCRSGSTALLNAFVMAGWDGIFQPVKTALRRHFVQDNTPVRINASGALFAIKESLGPYNPAEIYYDPLRVLQEKGLTTPETHLVVLLRKPEDCLLSWIKGFGRSHIPDFRPTLFSDAYAATLEAYYNAVEKSIPVSAICCQDLTNVNALSALMVEIGEPFRREMTDWTQSSKYQENEFGFEKPVEPEIFRVKGLLDSVRFGVGLARTSQTAHNVTSEISRETSDVANLPRARETYEAFRMLRFDFEHSTRLAFKAPYLAGVSKASVEKKAGGEKRIAGQDWP